VGHREGDFDFDLHLCQLFPHVNNINFCTSIKDPAALLGVRIKPIYQPEGYLIIWGNYCPDDAFCPSIAACFPKDLTHQTPVSFTSNAAP